MQKTYYIAAHSSSNGRITSIYIFPPYSNESLQEYYQQAQKIHLKDPLTKGGIEITLDVMVKLRGFTAFTQEGLPLTTEPGVCGYHSPDGRIHREAARIKRVDITLESGLVSQLAALIGGMVPIDPNYDRFRTFMESFVQNFK